MKKLLKTMLTGIMLTICFTLSYGISPAFSVATGNPHGIEVQMLLPKFTTEVVELNGKSYQRIKLAEGGLLSEPGHPELPMLSALIAIPGKGSVEMEILDVQSHYLNNLVLLPSQEAGKNPIDDDYPKFVENIKAPGLYPGELVLCSEPQILRDFRLVTIQVNPFAWDETTECLIVRDRINFKLNFTNQPGQNEIPEPTTISSAFAKIYEANIINFEEYRNRLEHNAAPRYLIIHGEYNNQLYLDKLSEFAFWKRQKGAEVQLVSTSVTGNTNTAVKAYIQARYDNPSTRPDFIILIGDTSGSFPVPTWLDAYIPQYPAEGDYPYQYLAGNDYLGDAFLGRMSAENISELDVLFSKVYLYEKNLNMNNAQWLNRMLLVGDTFPSGQSCVYTNLYIKDVASKSNPDYSFNEIYANEPSPAMMNAGINQGVGIFNYRGYIGMSGWDPGTSLMNGAQLPHAVVLTCGTGDFDGINGITERFIRLGTSASPAGALTATGIVGGGTHTMYNNSMTIGAFNGIFTKGMRTMGESILNAKLTLHEMYFQTRPNQVRYFGHATNLMGDPTVEVFCAIPSTFLCNAPSSLPSGTVSLELTVVDQNNLAASGACLTFSQGTTILAHAYTDANGKAVLFLSVPLAAGEAVITVSKENFKPLQQIVTVSGAGSLVAASAAIDDDTSGSSNGNGNSLANRGETLEIRFSIKNTTQQVIYNVTGTADCGSEYATLSSNTVNFVNVNPGATSVSIFPVVTHISESCPHNTIINFQLNLQDAQDNSYHLSFYAQVGAASMQFIEYQVQNTDQALDPGESATFAITLKNSGNLAVNELQGQLITLNDLILVQDNTCYYGLVEVNSLVTPASDLFQIYARPQTIPGTVIPLRMKLWTDSGFEQWLDFTFTVGNISQSDPLGPDAYGYVIYDMADTDYAECPVYDWLELATLEGGFGNELPLLDTGTPGDEGDAVGAVTLAVVDLPFSFRFYGQGYDQITVCSNGFIAMGVTQNANYRNFRLPGSVSGGGGAPGNLIAPFWDDLISTGGGVFTYNDEANHRYIIEWYNYKNALVPTASETFQIVLFDPVYHATSSGDGPVKILYHTFNNVDIGSTSDSYSGNYCTIGIQNADQTVGLEYSFNNTYPQAALPLTDLSALYITTSPVYSQAANLCYESFSLQDGNNKIPEPGETLDLYVKLQNNGEQSAQDISASLSCSSPFVTLQSIEASYPDLEGWEEGENLIPFSFSIAPECPDRQNLQFSIHLNLGSRVWDYSFSLYVSKPSLEYCGLMIVDTLGNNNSVADPGENVFLVVNVKNLSTVAIEQFTGNLSSPSTAIQIQQPVQTFSHLGGNQICQLIYSVSLTTANVGTSIPFSLSLSAANTPNLNSEFSLVCGSSGTVMDLELSNGGFTSLRGWQHGEPQNASAHSGSRVWATELDGMYNNNAQYTLLSPEIIIPPNASLSFWHRLSCQNYYDGGNVSISTNGGNSWSLINPVGGYNSTLPIAALGENGYSGEIGWTQAVFELGAFSGSSIIIRWRFGSDYQSQGLGWMLDDVMVSGYFLAPGKVSGNLNLDSGNSPETAMISSDSQFLTHPATNGNYTLYLPHGIHSLFAGMQNYGSQTASPFDINNQTPVYSIDFTLNRLPSPDNLNISHSLNDSLACLSWAEPEPGSMPLESYNLYRRFNNHYFIVIGNTVSPGFMDELENSGTYSYYVSAVYSSGESAPSNVSETTYENTGDSDPTLPNPANRLLPNYPNPFNPRTIIPFTLSRTGRVKLSIFNLKGQLVKTLFDDEKAAGLHELSWNGLDDKGRPVSSGIYFYKLQTKGFIETAKMILMK